MPNYLSPGSYTFEKDFSQYAPTISSSVVGIVGFANKGPQNKATLLTSPQQARQLFGSYNSSISGQGLIAVEEIMEQTDQVYFVRANDGGTEASAGIQLGVCPAINVTALANEYWGLNVPLTLNISGLDSDGDSLFTDRNDLATDGNVRQFTIPAGTVSTTAVGAAFSKIVGGGLDNDKVGVSYDPGSSTDCAIYNKYSGLESKLYVSAGSVGVDKSCLTTYNRETGVAGITLATNAYSFGSDINVTSLSYNVRSLYDGIGYNYGSMPNGEVSGNSIEIDPTAEDTVILTVNEEGSAAESFKISTVSGLSFVEQVINVNNTQNLKSDIIQGSLYHDEDDATLQSQGVEGFYSQITSFLDGVGVVTGTTGDQSPAQDAAGSEVSINARFCKFKKGTYNLNAGTNGSTGPAELIGDANANPKTGMQALDDDILDISVATVPGITTPSVQNALITLAEATQAFIAVVSPPVAVGNTQAAIDWTNGRSDERTSAINSSYAAIYWPWVQVYNVQEGKDSWYDPAIFGVRQMMYTDSNAETWFAPAGTVRGRLTKPTATEVQLNKGDRDALYSGGNVINSIANFARDGITVWGQRTAQRTPSALDRINVRRLMIQLRKVILQATRAYVFEPNDEFTWSLIEDSINPLLDDIKRRRGINEFRVVCDKDTNTPARQDRNELWCNVLIKPTKTAEMIIVPLNLTNQSAQLGEL